MTYSTYPISVIPVQDLPDLGAVNDACSVVGEHAGTGRFTASLLKNYVMADYASQTDATKGSALVGWKSPAAGSVGRTLSNRLTDRVHVKDFGAVCDGVADDTAAINAAIASLPAHGGTIELGHKHLISSTIQIGNGSAAAPSTKNGIVLRGMAGVASAIENYHANIGTEIIWGAAAGAHPMIAINGGIQGWGLHGIRLTGGNIANYGVYLACGSFGDVQNLSVSGCIVAVSVVTYDTGGTNCIGNRWHNLQLMLGNTANGIGLNLRGGVGPLSGNPCYNDFSNLMIQLHPTVACFGIYLAWCDTNTFRNVMITGGSVAATGVQFDYGNPQHTLAPTANSFYSIDPKGIGSQTEWAIVGIPSNDARPNYIYGLGQANGAAYPNIDNLIPSLPTREAFYSVLGRTAGLGAQPIYTPRMSGLFRINYAAVITVAGASGTVQPVFGATTGGVQQNAAGATVAATAVGNTANGSVVVYADRYLPINTAVSFDGPAPASFNYYVAIDRLA